jgi:hypothetical protein
MEAGELQFEVAKSKINWGTYFQDLMKPKFGSAASQSAGFEGYSGRGPSVVACNSAGERRVVLGYQEDAGGQRQGHCHRKGLQDPWRSRLV